MAMKFNKLKSLFVTEEENTQNPDDSKPVEEQKEKKQVEETVKSKVSWETSGSKNTDGNDSKTPADKSLQSTSGNFNPKISDSLIQAISEQNLPGEDYLEFMDAIQAMKDLPLEESIKMKTVFMTLSTKGLTIPKIVESAGHYLNVLNKEKEKFNLALEAQKNHTINDKKKIISEIEAKNIQKAELIKKLTDEIASNNSEIQKITIEINMGESKIKSTENDFIYTFDKISNQIKENIEKIKLINGQ
jgi:hypothetical protein